MIYFLLAIAIIWTLVSELKEKGGVTFKLSLSCIVATVAFIVIFWITGLALLKTLAKVCIAAAILILLGRTILAIFGI